MIDNSCKYNEEEEADAEPAKLTHVDERIKETRD